MSEWRVLIKFSAPEHFNHFTDMIQYLSGKSDKRFCPGESVLENSKWEIIQRRQIKSQIK